MNRSAFTLIEVLVSVAILAVVATGLFQISLNSKNNFDYLNHKATFDRLSAIGFMHNDQKHHHKQKNLYEFLRYDYTIKDDAIRTHLKKLKVSYTQEEYSTFSPLGDIAEKIDDSNTFEQTTENNNENIAQSITFVFDKITIADKYNSTYAYKIYMRQ